MYTISSQITSLAIVYSTFYSDADQRKHQSSTSLAFVRGIGRWQVNSPHKGPVTRKLLPFDDVIMITMINNSDDTSGVLTLFTLACVVASRGVIHASSIVETGVGGTWIWQCLLTKKTSVSCKKIHTSTCCWIFTIPYILDISQLAILQGPLLCDSHFFTCVCQTWRPRVCYFFRNHSYYLDSIRRSQYFVKFYLCSNSKIPYASRERIFHEL